MTKKARKLMKKDEKEQYDAYVSMGEINL